MRLNGNRLTELAYVAGLFDGEGCVVIGKRVQARKRRPPYVQHILMVSVANTNRPALDRLREMFGGCIITEKMKYAHHTQGYTWSITSLRAARFLRRIRRYVRIKADQVNLALRFQATLDWTFTTPEKFAQREEMKLHLAALKRT